MASFKKILAIAVVVSNSNVMKVRPQYFLFVLPHKQNGIRQKTKFFLIRGDNVFIVDSFPKLFL